LEEKIWPIEKKLTPEDVYWGSLLGMVEMIKSGITGFADMYFFMDEVARAAEESGMRCLLSYGIIAQDKEEIREELHKALDLVKNWNGEANGRINVALSPHAVYSTVDQLWKKVRDEAEKRNLVIHTHLAETEKEVKDFRQNHGISPVQYLNRLGIFNLPTLAAHCVHVDKEDIMILLRKNVSVVHNPGSNMKLGSGIAPIDEMLDQGVCVSLGTDGAASNNNLDIWEEIRLASLLQKAVRRDPTKISCLKALEMGTLGGASALRWKDVGEIKEGNKADLVIVNIDQPHLIPRYNLVSNLVYSARASDVETVIINGKIVMENKEVLTVDEDKVKNKVCQLQRKYAQ
jgi:5-methylthioadenosine/S-adenosylhomocysteine deaminase